MKRFIQNEQRVRVTAAESNIRTPLSPPPGKSVQSHYTKAVAAIFAVIVLHFVSQSIFFQSEKDSLKTEAISHRSVEIEFETERQSAQIETEPTAKEEPQIETTPQPPQQQQQKKKQQQQKTILPVAEPELKPAPPPTRVVIKKKETRESRAERLRRAEKILTGV